MSPVPRPTASLATFPLRSKQAVQRKAKGGDITGQIDTPRAPEPAPAPAPAPTPQPAEPPPRAEEIVVYWERVRRGRALPPLAEIDCSLVANAWPDSLIVLFDRDPSAMPRVSRLGASAGAIEYTPMVTDWILSGARQAARRAMRLDEVRSFPIDGEMPRYRLFLLPLGGGPGASDAAVLCHLCPSP